MNSVKYVVCPARKQQLYVQCFQEKFTSSSQAFLYFTNKIDFIPRSSKEPYFIGKSF